MSCGGTGTPVLVWSRGPTNSARKDDRRYGGSITEPGVTEAKDLRDYDIILVSSSSGKDSQTMLHFVHEMAERQDVENRIVVVHCDLGRAEWPGARELAEEQCERYGYRFEVVKRRQGDLLQHIEQRGMFPDPARRYCTSDHKRSQVQRLVTKLGREILGKKPEARILSCMGMRAEESPARRKMPQFEMNRRASTKQRNDGTAKRLVHNWLPIQAWSRNEVWDSIRRTGVPYHRAYDLGMPRLSCRFCIFASFDALVVAARANPELLEAYIALERRIGHRFKKDLSLVDVKEAAENGYEVKDLSDTWNM